jgi:hypothetical protein
MFSGFQLDLYCAHEKPFAYWYVTQVIETHLGCIDDLVPQLSPGTHTQIQVLSLLLNMAAYIPDSLQYKEFQFQHTFLTALQCMSMGTALVSHHSHCFRCPQQLTGSYQTLIKQGKGLKRDSDTLDPGFARRYKWAFNTDHVTRTKDMLIPNMAHYIEDCDKITGEVSNS